MSSRPSTVTQSVLLPHDRFHSAAQARAWLKRNGYKTNLEPGKTFYRARQHSPHDFVKSSFRTKRLPGGVDLVIGHLKGERARENPVKSSGLTGTDVLLFLGGAAAVGLVGYLVYQQQQAQQAAAAAQTAQMQGAQAQNLPVAQAPVTPPYIAQ